MIYYSTIPIEMAFYRPDELKLKQIQVDGVKMIVHEGEEGEATIVQVLSGDPGHFLDPRFQPGNTIKNVPTVTE
ncbi:MULTISPECIES: YlzJ-like family protein [Thermoactinomyces]|jgi:hypothetical protein|uniref:YlzJ-like family protein n=1 Tax=Thermoactinomyces vulgaris TaxID=2026 RepID=A0ABS0QIZ9_THEVU|nr:MULTISPECIES: YlzJ-like family protein [Thermoactinomyces]KFZ40080.1 hypothetical protein JS81_10340 [Thermoactinomyces sp. Gus2-1]KYQ85941.1 hypothetical protein AYX07_11070 [Thermoactinomyces sp. AS95]MBA4552329.1 YlzJ-like family protein [Thermoactinomyces vulgaris]MBA4597244.1 YlzJ-like family protein [Thermoactinomyces vulgaris]MBH8582615.1 YlzJ-like family protein [Thermoactinomyces sp. CICC 10735]